jgi:hypothetical protein
VIFLGKFRLHLKYVTLHLHSPHIYIYIIYKQRRIWAFWKDWSEANSSEKK